MKKVKVLHYDAFSSVVNQGNPAGVVLDFQGLNEDDMLRIAGKVGFNETVFVLKSDKADLRLKYFTPGHEMNLCGHATVGALYCLRTRGLLEDKNNFHIETNVGVLPVSFENKDEQILITMQQDAPRFIPFEGDVRKLAESIGLTKEELDLSKPIVYGSTGTWTLLIPIKELSKFKTMQPRNEDFPQILAENPRSSVHPICFQTYDGEAMMHSRHFSSPFSGTVEDPVTGTASGVMGAYYLKYINERLPLLEFAVEQGQEIGRDGRVWVRAVRNGGSMDVFISGTGVFVKEMEVDLE
ncbi:PhzF family phenazine biosynthesis protein [Paenibacillus macerans]|uniref:Phenazine biosynthesis, PhzF family protein n=1 Tax=Paenibacillus macerans TaxID=44252 RepID=A0A090YB08_PAEMA|nr:PhzF family phenazine biosynthesis isomerase [Paenibacillus macerans]KFM95968.1 phenazine biosynthesis, PhzF family protein [Paenibacillus macerans]MCY7558800.1 PhzF family phenazine biosynthesis isomerase [Paenibacillus macerans]MEC0149767.1 PhzF family phenazine biosynthesis isomerase [Paenibacillus macerans]SUA83966.1 phenazine biosynthesis protein PhzF family [Paenibacillus macerans]